MTVCGLKIIIKLMFTQKKHSLKNLWMNKLFNVLAFVIREGDVLVIITGRSVINMSTNNRKYVQYLCLYF